MHIELELRLIYHFGEKLKITLCKKVSVVEW